MIFLLPVLGSEYNLSLDAAGEASAAVSGGVNASDHPLEIQH